MTHERGVAAIRANEMAELLVPSARGDRKFWTDAARTVVSEVIQSFIQSDRPWTLCDVVRALKTPTLIRMVLGRNKHVADAIFRDERVAAGLISTIADAMLPLAGAIQESFTKDGGR